MAKTPFMKMDLPVPGTTPAGEWGGKLNKALEVHVDEHDHSEGKGRRITPLGMKIDRDLPMSGNQLTEAKSVELLDQPEAPLGTRRAYASGGDLYWIDGHGRSVRLTRDGAVVPGIEGSILGLTPPAEARYDSNLNTFQFLTNATTMVRAVLDASSLMLRRMVQGAKYVLLKTHADQEGDYDLTLPAGLPNDLWPMFLDEDGQISTDSEVQTQHIADEAVTRPKISPAAAVAYTDTENTFEESQAIAVSGPNQSRAGLTVGTSWVPGIQVGVTDNIGVEVITQGADEAVKAISAEGVGVRGKGFRGGVRGEGDGFGPGLIGTSESGYGAELYGNATRAPLRLVPAVDNLPDNPEVGDICVFGVSLWLASKTSPSGTTFWRELAFKETDV